MKKTSINGWEVIESYGDPRLDMKRVPGTTVRIKMHKEVLPLFLALVADYHKEVAKLRPRETGAFNPRKSQLSPTKWSDHASGTAVDINWNHEGAVGVNGGMKTMSNRQIRACAAIKERYEIVIWGGDKARGGDYRTPSYWDPMHYALKPGTTLAQVRRVIRKLGIRPNGKRAGVSYGVTDSLKAVVAKENVLSKPEEQKVVKDTTKKPVKKAVKKTAKKVVKKTAKKKPVKKVAKKAVKKTTKKKSSK